ncbi:MAG: hypothetical protein IJ568_05410 [Bacilli bacterium]|nr:hypothetical protein [Bacilli bacterium]
MNDDIKIEPIEMDNGIGFRGSISLSKEEIAKRVDFLEKHSKEFNKLVIKAENELYIKELLKRNNQLQSNWNSLKELIEKRREHYRYFKDNRYRKFLSELLDEMNELEGKDKE